MRVNIILSILGLSVCNAKSQEQNVNVIPKSETINCYGTEVKLPKRFVRLDRVFITHTWNRGCTYSSESDEDSLTASLIYIENHMSTEQFLNRFNDVEAKAIAKYHVLNDLSWTYQYGGIPDYFEKELEKHIFLCYKDSNKNKLVTYTTKQCFSFIKGVLVQIGYTHSSAGKVSILNLEESLSSVER